jgi:hypothetical protein
MRCTPILAVALLASSCTSLADLATGGDDSGATADVPDAGYSGDAMAEAGLDTGADGYTDAATVDASDANTTDGGVDSAPSEAGPVNLLPNPGFEQSLGSGCVGWNNDNTTATLSNVAHSGAHSCLVCPSPVTSTFFSLEAPQVDASAGSSFYAEAWLMAPPSGPPAATVAALVYLSLPDGGGVPNQANQLIPAPPTWTLSSESFTVGSDGKLMFTIHGYYPDGGCVLVDDTALYQQ